MTAAPQAKLPWHRPIIIDITPPNGKWRRPMIWDITPANYPPAAPNHRPDADQAAAGHRVVGKRYQRQRQRRAEENPSKPEDIRLAHLRWGELQRLMRHRYGVVMPNTADARRDLEILIGYAILTGHKPSHQAELWAPWLPEDEADHLAAHQRPVLHKADDLAKKLDLQYCDRQRVAITTIGSVDVDQTMRERLRCQRRNEAKRLKLAAKPERSTMETNTAELTARQRKVLAKIGDAEIAVADLVDRLARCKVFRGASMRQRVHEALDHLIAVGLVADRSENHPQGGKIRFVWHQRPSRA
jgi:hypothetical protein